jgi:hypothetical protein
MTTRARVLTVLAPIATAVLILLINDNAKNDRGAPVYQWHSVLVLAVLAVLLALVGPFWHTPKAGYILTAITIGVVFFAFAFGTLRLD